MALLTGVTFHPLSFTLNSGNIVVKLFVPATIGATFLGEVPVNTVVVLSPGPPIIPPNILNANFNGMMYDRLWKETTQLISGTEATGFTQSDQFPIGNILTQQIRIIQLYNAREISPMNVLTVTLVNFDGITLDDTSQPDFVNNRTTKFYQFTISPNGPPVINATATFVTDAGETFVVTITGSRTVVVPFVPQLPAKETLQYKTWIQRHKLGTEQRQGFRDVPRQTISYEYLNTEQVSSQVENFFYLRAGAIFGVPYWPGATKLIADANIGATTFTVVDSVDKGFRSGTDESLALILRDNFTFEAVQVTDITSDVFTLSQALIASWVVGDFVIPIRRAFSRQPRQLANTWAVRRWQVTFDVIAANLKDEDETGFTQFLGLPVFENLLFLQGNVFPRDFNSNLEVFDSQTSTIVQNTQARSPAMTSGFLQEFDDLSSFFTFYRFYQAMQGRRAPFWVRTGLADFQIFQDQPAGTDLRIKNIKLEFLFDNNTSLRRKNIAIEYADGVIDYRVISAVVEVNNTREDVTLQSGSSQVLSETNVHLISWMQKVRFATDELDITHTSGNVIVIPVSITDLDE